MTDPYFTQIVLSTRPDEANSAFASTLQEHGINMLSMPMIQILPPESWYDADEAIDALEVYSGIIFSSVNAVAYFIHRLQELQRSVDELPPVYAVGEKTAAALTSIGIPLAYTQSTGGGAELATAIENAGNQYYLHPTSDIARTELNAIIDKRGGRVNNVCVYRTVRPTYNDIRAIDDQLIMGEIDCIAFFSPSAIQNFIAIIPEFKQATVLVAVIGQTTATAAITHGLRVDVIAPEQTAESLAHAIAARFESNERIDFNDGEQVDVT